MANSLLSSWFNIGKNGKPVRSGWYYWEIWMNLKDGGVTVLHCMGWYDIILKQVKIDGRWMNVKSGDYWQGVLK